MNSSELETFIVKFRNLWKAGLDAHLDIESHAGQAWVGLRVRLGPEPGPAQQHPPFPPHVDKKTRDGPSRQRRRARRAAARAEQAEQGEEQAVQAGQEQGDQAGQAGQTKDKDTHMKAEKAPRKAAESAMKEKPVIVEAAKVTEIVDGANACESKKSTEIVDEFCPDIAYQVGISDGKEVTFTFLSDYGEEDILDSFPEIFPGIDAKLASRVRVERLSADHFCTVVLHPVHAETFSWPAMDPVNTEVFRSIKRIQK